MSSVALAGSWGLFNDELFTTTDLNRRTGEVLNRARKAPVTISRNGEQFALLKREQAAELVRTVLHLGPTLEFLEGAFCVVEREEPPVSVAWLKAFHTDDIRQMVREILAASVSALRETGDWDAVDAIIHEWHESALVARSGVLDEALNAPLEEAPLPDPRTVVEP
ncbi:MAG: type II toxin-antitoxin system prevent-host-death family antitoxin [Acidobacteria bacterium]|nr:type II toxin-antitoxin system prevent-host-death family antitoxin [Acidobacteriota bacterium]